MARSVSLHSVDENEHNEKSRTNAERERDRFRNELDALLRKKNDEVTLVERQYGKDSPAYIRQRERYEHHDNLFKHIAARLNRPLKRRQISGWIYASIAVVLAGMEAPINKFIFDVVLQSVGAISWTVSFLLGLMLFAFAHWNGLSIRHLRSETRKRFIVRNCVIAPLLTLLLVVLICILSVARWRYSLVNNATGLGSLVGDLSSQLKSLQGLFQVLKLAFSDSASQTLAAVNSAAIVLAMLLSFITHDPDEDYDFAWRNIERAEQALTRIERKYNNRMFKINQHYAPEIEQLEEDIAVAKQFVNP
jgi:hypothetical protein